MRVKEIIEQIKDGVDIFNTKYFYINGKTQTVETCVIHWVLLSDDLDGIEEQGGTKFSSLLDTSGPRYAQLSFTGFTNVGDKCVTHLKVKNNTPASAGLSASLGALNTTAPASQDYFAISYDWGEAKTTLASGESTYIVITVELTKARIDETQAAGTSFDVSFVATAVYA